MRISIWTLFVFQFLLFLGCNKLKEEDKISIVLFVSDFYNNIYNHSKDDFEKLFYNGNIKFYFQDEEFHEGYYTEEVEKLLSYFSSSRAENGDFINYRISEIGFERRVYDVPEIDLFYVFSRVNYLRRETFEIFLLKKVDNTFKIYRYTVEYN